MPQKLLPIPTSPYSDYCDGYGNPGSIGNGYILSFVLGIGKTKLSKTTVGSHKIDAIDAFDKAEVQGTTIGQINMITVSSFCGPMGYIWGYDLARHDHLYRKPSLGLHATTFKNKAVPVFSLKPLLEATKALYGTVDDKHFPIMPGSHVPCAKKSITEIGPKFLYCGLAIGIPKNRRQNACLLMEDVGWVEDNTPATQKQIFDKVAQSILRIGENQKVEYKEIFADINISYLKPNEMGCALVASPYFTLAQNAIPNNTKLLSDMNLDEWKKQFLKR